MQQRINHSKRSGIHADGVLCIFDARLRVIAFRPPFIIIAMEAFAPAIGLSTSEAAMLMTLPPDFCASIRWIARWVM